MRKRTSPAQSWDGAVASFLHCSSLQIAVPDLVARAVRSRCPLCMRADVNRPVLAMLIVSLGALLASGCGSCGSGSSAVGLPDGGVTAADRVDGGAGMLTQQACMRSYPASN